MSKPTKSSSGSAGIGGMFKSFTKSFKANSTYPAAYAAHASTANEVQDLQVYLEKSKSSSVTQRIEATEAIRASIDAYDPASIPEIWMSVEDMVSSRFTSECRRAVLKLMIACIKRGNVEWTTRMSFYNCLVKNSNAQDFDLQLEAMKELTHNGKYMADFFEVESRIPDVLGSWFRFLATETQEIRIGRRSQAAKGKSHGSSIEENFHSLIRFIFNAFRHNHSLFSDRDVYFLVSEATMTCRKTSSESDMEECLSLISVIISNSYMPIENLTSLLEVLCGVASIPSRAEQAWEIIVNLSRSYIANNTFACLCKILEATNKKEVNSNTMRGAARYLQRLIAMYVSERREVEISVVKVLQAYNASLAIDSLQHNYEICCCIYNLIEDPSTRSKFSYHIWESRELSPLEIIYRISSTPFVQKFASHVLSSGDAPSISMFSSLSRHSTSDRSQAHATARQIVEKFKQLFSLMADIFGHNDFDGSKEVVIDFFVDMSPFIDERCAIIVIEHFKLSHYCNPLSKNWIENTEALFSRFFQDISWGTTVRQNVLNVVSDSFEIAKEICEQATLVELISKVFEHVEDEPDNLVLETMIQMFEEIAKDSKPKVLEHISQLFLAFFPDGSRRKSVTSFASTGNDFSMHSQITSTQNASLGSIGAPYNGGTSPLLAGADKISNGGSPMSQHYTPVDYRKQLVSSAFCRIFVHFFKNMAAHAALTYRNLLHICKRSLSEPLAFTEVARLLFRIRTSGEGYIYLANPSNMDGLATCLGRNLSGKEDLSIYKSTMSWWYPETVSYLYEEDLDSASWVLKLQSDAPSDSFGRTANLPFELDISLWFNDVVVKTIETGGHWEIYSFIWAHLAPQLSNVLLFLKNGSDLQRLRQIICDQISGSARPPQVVYPKDVTRNDLKVVMIRTISTLISYQDMFSTEEEDQIVRALVEGMSVSEKAVIPCIHGLLVCSYELPLSVKKCFAQIFEKFQQRAVDLQTSPHILEFLLSISRLPLLKDTFTQDEYKAVFDIAAKHIQYAHDIIPPKDRTSLEQEANAFVDAKNRGKISNVVSNDSSSVLLLQYLLVLAYDTVATWFLTLRVSDRKFMATFIIRRLVSANGVIDDIDPQSLAHVDLISRFTYSNLDLTAPPPSVMKSESSSYTNSDWIFGSSIVSIKTETKTGESQVTIRRPTGTSVFNLKPNEKMIPAWLEKFVLKQRENNDTESASQRLRASNTVTFTPNYFLLQLFVPVDINESIKPIPLSQTSTTAEALSTLDHTSVVDFHKIKVTYVPPSEDVDSSYSNIATGSLDFKKFLDGMGKLTSLKDNRNLFTGSPHIGSDVETDYAYLWNDKVTQVLFCQTTALQLPLCEETGIDVRASSFQNAGVNIFFDDSDSQVSIDELQLQPCFVNIAITPVHYGLNRNSTALDPALDFDTTSPVMRPQTFKRDDTQVMEKVKLYKVRVICKPGVPTIFAACHLKMVSEKNLPVFVRNISILASKFSRVWNENGSYVSNWQSRLKQIDDLKESVHASLTAGLSEGLSGKVTSSNGLKRGDAAEGKEESNITQSFLDQLTSTEPTEPLEYEKKDSGPGLGLSTFTVDDPDGQDDHMPLLKHLDFSAFT